MRRALALLVAALLPGAAWPQEHPVGPEFQVNTYTTERQEWPAVAADALGNFVVVWQSIGQDGSLYGVFGQRYASSGTPVGPEFRLNSYTTNSQYHPAVAADSSGNFVVVWESFLQDGSEFGVFGQRYSASGAPLGPEFRVNTYTTDSQAYPSVAADSSGNFVVVWHGVAQDGFWRDIFGQRYAASGAPLGTEFRVNTITTFGQNWPSVAADPSGNFIVVWSGYGGLDPGPQSDVFGRRYASSGAPLGPEFRVNTYTTNLQSGALVAVDPSGGFVVAWGSYGGVFGQRYSSSGAPLGPEFRANTYTPGSQLLGSLATDSSGNFVVLWEDSNNLDIFGQLYASSGSPIGPHFIVNTYTMGITNRPAVAADPSGHFVVAWESYLQDGSHNGVFGQRFDSMVVPVELMHLQVE